MTEGARLLVAPDEETLPGGNAGHPPAGIFMCPLPPVREEVAGAPRRAGCYLIYLDGEIFYAGRSTTDIRRRLLAHANGYGSRKVRDVIREGIGQLTFEYCDIRPEDGKASTEDIARFEFFFMAMHTGERPLGNLRWDGWRSFGAGGRR